MQDKDIILIALAGFIVGLCLGTIPGYWFTRRLRFMEHLVEIKNNLFGTETIRLDGDVVVSKFTFLKPHKFMIGENRAEVAILYRWHLLSTKVRFTVNDQVVYED